MLTVAGAVHVFDTIIGKSEWSIAVVDGAQRRVAPVSEVITEQIYRGAICKLRARFPGEDENFEWTAIELLADGLVVDRTVHERRSVGPRYGPVAEWDWLVEVRLVLGGADVGE